MPSPIRKHKPKTKKGGKRKSTSPRRRMSGGYTGEPGIKHVFVTLFTDVDTAAAEHEIDELDRNGRAILSTQNIENEIKEYVSSRNDLGLQDVELEFYEQSTQKTNGSVFLKNSQLRLPTGEYERVKIATFRVVAKKPTK